MALTVDSTVSVESLLQKDMKNIDPLSVLSKTWRVKNKQESSYTGGKVVITADGAHIVCRDNETVNFISIASGQIVYSLECGEEDSVTAFAISHNNKVLYTSHARSFQIKSWDIQEKTLIRSWKGHDLPITDMCIDPTSTLLATGCVDKSVRVWDAAGGFCTHNLTGHSSMITRVLFHPHPNRMLLAAGSDNGHIRLHDLTERTQNDLVSHMSAVTGLSFSYCGESLLSGGRDGVWCRWDVTARVIVATVPCFEALETIEVLPPGVEFTTTRGKTVVTSGQLSQGRVVEAPTDCYAVTVGDKGLLRVWNVMTKRCIYTMDHAALLQRKQRSDEDSAPGPQPPHIAFQGVLSFHPDMRTRDFTPIPVEKQEGGDENLDDFFPLRVPTFTTVSMEHNFSFFEIASMRRRKTLIGFNDDIVDVKLIPNTRIAAVATNSPQIRLFNLDTMAAELVTGHPESVMTIEVSPCGRFLASTSRDATVRIWLFEAEPEGESQGVGLTARCIGLCQGHAESISALAFSVKSADLELKSKSNAFTNSNAARSGASHVSNYNACGFFSITGARDRTMKVWNLSPLLAYVDPAHAAAFSAGEAVWVRHNDEDIDVSAARSAGELVKFVSQSTVLAHEKDINSVAIAPNNKMIASCSQDKTVKLWQLQSGILSPITTMRGHKRGVWCVAFAPVDKVLMTSSSDKTIRLWSVTDFTCIRTFQGHQAPVLRAVFLRAGMQLMSADGDGVMKLWTVADGECVTTLDEPHDQRVWGLAADPKDRMLVSGGADSRLVVWEDTTAYDIALQDAESQARAVQEQHLVNALRKREWEKSFDIALSLAHPRRVYSVLSELVDAETRYKRWRHLRNKRHAARAARRRARVTAGGEDEDSDQEEEFLFIEAKENLELKVPKPSTTVARMMTHRTVDELEKLVAYIQEWNTNSKFSHVAQYTLSALVSTVAPEVLRDVPRIKDAIAALNVYSQRHFTRVNTLLQSSYLIDYVFSTVNMLAPAVELEGEDVGDGNKYMMNVLQLDVEDSGLEDEIVSDSEDELADDGADDEDEDADEDAADEDVSDDEAEEVPRKKQPVDDDEEEIDAIMAKLDRKLPTDGSKLLGDVEESQEAYEVDDSDSAFWQSAGNWESSSVPESSPVSAPEAVPKKRKTVAQADEKPATSSRRKKTRS